MKFCGNCGNRLEDNAVFCPECGAKAPAGPAQAAPSQQAPMPEVTEFQPHMKPDWQQAPVQPQEPQWQQAPAQQWDQQSGQPPQFGVAAVPPPVKIQAPGQEARFCQECGTRLAPDAIFCPECGAGISDGGGAVPPAGAAPGGAYYGEPQGKKPKKKIVGVIAALIAVIAVVAALAMVVPKLLVPDKVRFLQANAALAEKVVRPVETAQEKAIQGISTDITISGSSSQLPKDVQKILDDSALVMKIDTTGNAMLLNYVLQVSGTNLLSANFMYEGENASLSMPEITDKCYTMNVPKFLKNNGVDMELSAEDIKKLSGSKEFNDREMKRYGTILANAINKNNLKVEKKEMSFSHLSGRGKYKVYTWHPAPEDLEQLLKDIADELKNDEDLKQRLDEIIEAGHLTGRVGFKDADDAIKQMAKECKDAAKQAGDLDEDVIPEWVVAVQGNETRIISIISDGDPVFTYENSGKKGVGEECICVADGRDEFEIFRCKTEKDGKKSGFLGVEDQFLIDFEMANGKETILGLPVGSYTVSGAKETYAEIQVNSDGKTTVYAVSVLDGMADVSLVASEKGSAVKPEGKTVDITDYDDKELTALGEELGEEIAGNENLVEFFQSLGEIDF